MKTIIHTPGEPAGIGPEILLRLAQQPADNFCRVAVCDPEILRQTASLLGIDILLQPYARPRATGAGELLVIERKLSEPVRIGHPNPRNSAYVLACLDAAVAALKDQPSALVTGPLNKAVICEAGHDFSGHTKYLSELDDKRHPLMMLCNERLRVALVTTHLPLREVADAVTQSNVELSLRILNDALRDRFGLRQPRISVCGLNPHAGEQGHLGREDIEIVEPACRAAREAGINVDGPLPADTAFTATRLATTDAVLAMYHDQGLPVIKHSGFGETINVTLGLSFVRTSVDHGTALDLAGQGRADHGSLKAAEALALKMIRH